MTKISVKHMNTVCGRNDGIYKIGKTLTVVGLVAATVGCVLSTLTVYKLHPEDYEWAHEFVDAVLG